MRALKRPLMVVILLAWMAAAGCNRSRAPVDFLGFGDIVGNLHPATRHYPYSCPRCPQYQYPARAGH